MFLSKALLAIRGERAALQEKQDELESQEQQQQLQQQLDVRDRGQTPRRGATAA